MKTEKIEVQEAIDFLLSSNIYRAEIEENTLHIHTPSYINIDLDKIQKVEITETTYKFYVRNVVITIWKKIQFMHTVILK